MPSVLPQQVKRRALIERVAAQFWSGITPAFRDAQLARLDAIANPFRCEHAPAKAQQHNHIST